MPVTRRNFLVRGAALGCCAAASPLVAPVTFAAAPWEARLVVVILRGAMDALDVVQPYGAAEFAGLRPNLGGGPAAGAADLDGFFALHPGLGPLLPLWQQGQLGFVHAVATPYRDKRSHFDGQDLLESGTDMVADSGGGWLNRMLQHLPGTEARTAYAIGHGEMRVLDGPAPVADWSPEARLGLSPQAQRLAERMMQDDPLFHAALAEAMALSESGPGTAKGASHVRVAEFVAQQLRGDARVAAFSLTGWDTHRGQARALGSALGRLAETILTLKQQSGPDVWDRTAVVAMTEFGRTVRENGTGGTDHGTGGAMLLAGGAVRGGSVRGTWPGLAESDLYARRDLMPTSDVRAHAAWIVHGLTGLDRATLEGAVFPGLGMGDDIGLLR